MASLSQIESLINALPKEMRPVMRQIFTIVLRDLRFGHPSGSQPDSCTNFGAGFFTSVTPATPGDELTIPHTFGQVPYLAMPVLPLDVPGSTLVPLTVTRAADNKRLYLSSTVSSTPFSLVVEG